MLKREPPIVNPWLATNAEPTSAELTSAGPAAAALPKTAEPKTAEPKTAEPKTAEPKTAEPNAALPNAALPNAALPNADLPNADLPNADLPNADLPNADLPNADLINADLINADLINADLINADLINADLTDADLAKVELNDVDLNEVNLANVELTDDVLAKVDLNDVNLAGVASTVRWWQWPGRTLAFCWNASALVVLLAVIAAIPVVQMASLGYLLRASGNLSQRRPWRTAFPGLTLAGRLLTFSIWSAVLWLPVWLVTDLAYSVQLLRPGTAQATGWRVAAFVVALGWIIWISWAAMRGGRWWHMLWPAPIRFLRCFWRPATWSKAADKLADLVERLHFPSLWWLGLRAAAGALIWLVVPASLMIIGLRDQDLKPAALVGLIGAIGLTWVMLYLPYLQILVAEQNRFTAIFQVREVRRRFRHGPWAMAMSLLLLLALAIPLYLLRIEATPEQLTWLPSLVCVGLMFPARLAMGAAMGFAAGRNRPRHWSLRWSARLISVTVALFYVGSLYVAQFVVWQGIYVMYFQHAVLVPVAS